MHSIVWGCKVVRFLTRSVSDILVCQIANGVRGSTIRASKQNICLCWCSVYCNGRFICEGFFNESYVLGTRLLGCALSLTLHMLRKSLMTMKFDAWSPLLCACTVASITLQGSTQNCNPKSNHLPWNCTPEKTCGRFSFFCAKNKYFFEHSIASRTKWTFCACQEDDPATATKSSPVSTMESHASRGPHIKYHGQQAAQQDPLQLFLCLSRKATLKSLSVTNQRHNCNPKCKKIYPTQLTEPAHSHGIFSDLGRAFRVKFCNTSHPAFLDNSH